MTMKNLLTAVRSSHKTNRMDISVDNDYGESKEQTVNTNSITDQIETAYQTNCMKDAADLLTPGRLQQVFDQHPDWQNMTPEEFAHALAETVDTDAAAEREYLQEQMRMVQEAAAVPDEIYRMLEQFDLPNSAMNVNAIQSMMANRNQLFRQIFGEESTNPDREKKSQQKISKRSRKVLSRIWRGSFGAQSIGRGSGDIGKSCGERDEDDDLQR